MYYVYEYIDEDNDVAYIGKTSKKISTRIKQHCVEIKFNDLTKVRYLECQTKEEMDNLEMFLITHLNPYLNSDMAWHSYSEKTLTYPSHYQWIDYTEDIVYSLPYKELKQKKYNKEENIKHFISILRASESMFNDLSYKELSETLILCREDISNIIKEQLKNIRGF